MAGITSVGSTGYQQYYVSSSVSGGSATSSSAASSTNASQQRANKDIASLSDAVQDLNSKLKAFAKDGALDSLFTNKVTSDSFHVLARDSVDKLVKAYNKVNDILKSSKYITGEGAKLLDDVKSLLTGKNAAKYSNLGLEVNKQTDSIKFDDKKFGAFLDQDILSTHELLMSNNYLTTKMQDVVQSVLGKQAGYYFNTQFVMNA